MRVQLVMQAMVQNNCPMVAIRRTVPPHVEVRAWAKIAVTPPPPLVTAASFWTAKRKESSRSQPPMAEYTMERQMPLAAELPAECVSSDRWAEASYPVMVYCVSRAPMGRTMKR